MKKIHYKTIKDSFEENLRNCPYIAVQDWQACELCQHYSVCKQFKQAQEVVVEHNVNVRYERNNEVEVVIFNKPFEQTILSSELGNIPSFERVRNFQYNDQFNLFEPSREFFLIDKLRRSIANSQKRSIQKFYDYALANDWEYFFTLTFSSEKVDRFDDFQVKYKWQLFRQELQRNNPAVKILCVPEYHEKEVEGKRALHFHGFISNAPNITLKLATDSKGNALKSGSGSFIFNLLDWSFGYSTICIIPKEDNQRKVINYISKYISKNNDVAYGGKRYYHTNNLSICNSESYFCSNDDIDYLKRKFNLQVTKVRENCVIYRGCYNE